MRTCVRVAEATILHADLDAFYASVEQRDDPALRGRPVIVGRRGGAGGQLRGQGVRRADGDGRRAGPAAVPAGGRRAARGCRPTPRPAGRCSRCSSDTTPLVEGLSIDEAFLDVGGLRRISGTPPEIAARLRGGCASEVGLPITVGVARTKFLAKVASGVAKPDGLLVVPRRRRARFLHPLPVRAAVGRGPGDRGEAPRAGAATVGQVAGSARRRWCRCSGRGAGRHLHALAHNRDPRRVQAGARRRSIGAQRALGRSPRRPRSSTPCSWRWSTGWPGGCGKADRVGRTVVAAPALRRLHPGHPLPHPGRADGHHPDRARRRAGCSWQRPCR